MRITVEIEEYSLKHIMAYTGESKKSLAVAKYVEEFIHRQQAKSFGKMIMDGEFDYPAAPQQI